MTREIIFPIILGIHLTSFLLSCVLGPLRGHRLLPSVLGGLALGPFNLILIFGLKPPGSDNLSSRVASGERTSDRGSTHDRG